MDPLNKKEIGKRIKRLRKEKGLKQWQMADILAATQPAIHKYENGILPEVKRLLELARVGNTTVEWILTGQHWENGSEERERILPETYRLAERLQKFRRDELQTLLSALELLEQASRKVRDASAVGASELAVEELARILREYDERTRKVLAAALTVHDSVLESMVESYVQRYETLTAPASPEGEKDEGMPSVVPPVKVQGEVL